MRGRNSKSEQHQIHILQVRVPVLLRKREVGHEQDRADSAHSRRIERRRRHCGKDPVRSNRDCPTGEIGPDVKPCRDITDPFTTTHSKGDKSLDAVVTFVPPIVDVGEGETGK